MSAWATSNRRSELPTTWSSRIVPRILRRDPVCRLHLDGCTTLSTEVDHIGDKHDHRDANLRGVCTSCHTQRTQAQAQAAKPRRARTPEPHPGRL